MKNSVIRELTLYRYRYYIGYGLFVLFVTVLLLIDIGRIPFGVSDREMQSVVASNSLNIRNLEPSDVINLPYHLLQKASVTLFGLSPLSIRLPSLILAFFAAIALAITLHQWFRKNIAVLTLLIAASSVPFISMARSGTAGVLYMLLLLLILMCAVKLTSTNRGTFFWKILATVSALLLMYMPLGVYAIVAMLIAGAFHPHVRYQVKRTGLWQHGVLVVITIMLFTPLVLAGLKDIFTIELLLGIDALRSKLTLGELSASILTIFQSLFLFNRPEISNIMTPFLNLTTSLLVIIGLVRTIIDRHAARSYLLLIWVTISIPLLIINPSEFALLFVPCVILLAIGLEFLLREWYGVFPRNPYARIAALIPLSLIVLGLLAISTTRYFYAHFYTDTSSFYHPELSAIKRVVKPQVSTILVTPEKHVAFYDILRKQYPRLQITSQPPESDQLAKETIVLGTVKDTPSVPPKQIYTSHYKDKAVVLRVYSQNQ